MGLALARLRAKRSGMGAHLGCLSAVPAWGLRAPVTRGVFWVFSCRSDSLAERVRLGRPVQF